jgi:hypothetical protein
MFTSSMSKWLWALSASLVSAASVAQVAAPTANQPTAAGRSRQTGSDDPAVRKHALLIGASVYPALSEAEQLQGPSNDVALTATLLRERFGFADADIVTLVHENDAAMQPTYGNISREFDELAARAAPGDVIFILLAGHGSQVIDDDPADPNDNEMDGLDEVFLPEDITKATFKPAENVIRDDQIGKWLDAIRTRGAGVFFVADTCHSGDMARGITDADDFFRDRAVNMEDLNPPDALDAHWKTQTAPPLESGQPGSDQGIAETTEDDALRLAGLVALYAVNENSTEKEHPAPPNMHADGPVYGRLTYALNWVLTQSRRPLNYRDLAQQIRWRYQAWGWDDLGYMIGSAEELKRKVLGRDSWPARSSVVLSRDEEFGRLSINAGVLHGVTVGGIFKVYPGLDVGGDDAPVGCIRVVDATPTTARVEPCEFEDIPVVSAFDLPAPGRCELAYAAYGELRLLVGVSPMYPNESLNAGCATAEGIVRGLADRPGSLLRLVNEGEIPDAFILVDDDGLYLRRRFEAAYGIDGGAEDPESQFPRDAFGPFAAEEGPDTKLARALGAMAKAVNVRRLAASGAEMTVGDPDAATVVLEVVAEKWNPATHRYEPIDPLESLDVTDGDKVRVRVFNRSGSPVDVTILYVESAFRIRSYFPTAMQDMVGFNNRIVPDGKPAEVEFSINDSTTGLEDVIIIATLPEPGAPPQNFVFLEQIGIERGDGDRDSGLQTPLGQLLASAAYGVGERGGNAAPDIAKYAVNRLSWTVHKRPAPEP